MLGFELESCSKVPGLSISPRNTPRGVVACHVQLDFAFSGRIEKQLKKT